MIRFVIPHGVKVADADVDNVGFVCGIQQLLAPEKQWQTIRAIPILWSGGKKAALEPKSGSQIVRIAATKVLIVKSKLIQRMCFTVCMAHSFKVRRL